MCPRRQSIQKTLRPKKEKQGRKIMSAFIEGKIRLTGE